MRLWVCVWLAVCGCVAGQHLRHRQGGQRNRPGQGGGQGGSEDGIRLGLVSSQLGVAPVPSTGGNNVATLPAGCFCLPVNQLCPVHAPSLVIDVRIVNDPRVGKCPNQNLCCPRGGNSGPHQPVTQGPRQPVRPIPVASGRCGGRSGLQNPMPYRQAGFAEATFGEYPWNAVVLTRTNDYLGGGALISNQWVLTAAHKVFNVSSNNMQVRLGDLDVSRQNEKPGFPEIEVDVAQIIIHPNFNARSLINDVALLRLRSSVDLNRYPHINTVCLPEKSQIFHGSQRCYVTGFGKDAFIGGNFQTILKEVDVPVVDPFVCQERLKQTRLGETFVLDRNSFVCAGGIGGKDACTGDGGAPLVCEASGRFHVVGLVAWGIGCARSEVPGVYVNVARFADFIQQHIGRQG